MASHAEALLHWEQMGEQGTPLMLLHPNPMDSSCWLFQIAHLSTWFRTIAIDLPGYGRSPAPSSELTLSEMARQCWATVDAVTDAAAILVGVSVEANLTLYMAQQRPQRTLALVISGFGYDPAKAFSPRRVAMYREQGLALRAKHIPQLFSAAFRETPLARYVVRLYAQRNAWTSAENIAEMFRISGQPDPDSLFESVTTPTLIITGSEDGAHRSAFALQERIAGCELVTMEGTGHASHMERPWEFDQHLLAFLARRGLFDATLLDAGGASSRRRQRAGASGQQIPADAPLQRALVDVRADRHVVHARSRVDADDDLVVGPPAGLAPQDNVGDLRGGRVGRQLAGRDQVDQGLPRRGEVNDLFGGGDDDAMGAAQALAVQLLGGVGDDRAAGAQQRAVQHGLARIASHHDDVGTRDRVIARRAVLDGQAEATAHVGAEGDAMGRSRAVNADSPDRPLRPHGLGGPARDAARAQDAEHGRVLPGEALRQDAIRRGAAGAVNQGIGDHGAKLHRLEIPVRQQHAVAQTPAGSAEPTGGAHPRHERRQDAQVAALGSAGARPLPHRRVHEMNAGVGSGLARRYAPVDLFEDGGQVLHPHVELDGEPPRVVNRPG
jgi:pimeloyl-ACP methyl ester carboxylesterase